MALGEGKDALSESGKSSYSSYYQRDVPRGAPEDLKGKQIKALIGDYQTKNAPQKTTYSNCSLFNNFKFIITHSYTIEIPSYIKLS